MITSKLQDDGSNMLLKKRVSETEHAQKEETLDSGVALVSAQL